MQHGFRKHHSCESQLLLTVNDLTKSLNEGSQIDSILLDFSKAFDKVDHSKLCSKFDHYEVRGKSLSWIKDYLQGRTQTVVVNGKTSVKAAVLSGVPQGTVLGHFCSSSILTIYCHLLVHRFAFSRWHLDIQKNKLDWWYKPTAASSGEISGMGVALVSGI